MANYDGRRCSNRNSVTITSLILACFWIFCTQTILAQPPKAIKKGVFLVATNKLEGSSFGRTVIFLTHHNDEGALGLVINRPSSLSITDAFPGQDSSMGLDKLFLGGPVHPDSLFILSRDLSDPELDPVIDDVTMGMGSVALSKLFNKKSTSIGLRAYIGYSGWTAGQLEFEVKKGDWIIIEPRVDLIFAEDPKNIWQELSDIWSGHWI